MLTTTNDFKALVYTCFAPLSLPLGIPHRFFFFCSSLHFLAYEVFNRIAFHTVMRTAA